MVLLIASSIVPSVLGASVDDSSQDVQSSLSSSEIETEKETESENTAQSEAATLSGKLKEFSISKMFSDVKHALSNMNFIKWYTYYTMGRAVDENGTEQTIQANPVKPDAPEKPESPSGTATLPDDHKAEDVPTSERKTEDEPHPTYPEQPTSKPAESQPAAGSTNSSGQVYVPGFGYVDSSGDNTVIDGQDIYENGNKIGEMGGGN